MRNTEVGGDTTIVPTVDTQTERVPSVLVVHNAFSRFVEVDCDLLTKRFQVTVRHESSPRKLRFAEIWAEVKRHDLVYCWFASWHSFLPVLVARLQRKPAVVVIGGYDVASVPKAGYGSQRKGLTRYLARAVMRWATHLLPFSKAAEAEARAKVGLAPEKTSVVYLGVPRRNAAADHRREQIALTVGVVCRENLLRKGLLPFVQASHLLPKVRFIHAGPSLDDSIAELRAAASSNVEFLGRVSDQRLAELYEEASVYVQASLHEGFGMSVAEAMAAGCIPVVSRCGSLPEVVGDTGIYISATTPEAVAEGITEAFAASHASRLKAQRRVQELFSLDQREERLRNALESLSLPASLHSAVSGTATPLMNARQPRTSQR